MVKRPARLFPTYLRRARGDISQAEAAAQVRITQPWWAARESGSAPVGEGALRRAAIVAGMGFEEFLLHMLALDETDKTHRQTLRRAEAAARERREAEEQASEERPLAVTIAGASPGSAQFKVEGGPSNAVDRLAALLATIPGVERARPTGDAGIVLALFDPKETSWTAILAAVVATPLVEWPEHILARLLNNARLAHGIGVRAFREAIPAVDRALSQGSEVREQTVEKAAAVLGLTVHEALRTGLLYDPEVTDADKVDRQQLRARLEAIVAAKHPEARQRDIAAAAEVSESQISRFRRASDPRGDVLSEDALRRIDKATREIAAEIGLDT